MLERLWNLWCECEPEQEPLSQTVGLEKNNQAEPSKPALLRVPEVSSKNTLSAGTGHTLESTQRSHCERSKSDSKKTGCTAHSNLKILTVRYKITKCVYISVQNR